jgi:hypothetical protein
MVKQQTNILNMTCKPQEFWDPADSGGSSNEVHRHRKRREQHGRDETTEAWRICFLGGIPPQVQGRGWPPWLDASHLLSVLQGHAADILHSVPAGGTGRWKAVTGTSSWRWPAGRNLRPQPNWAVTPARVHGICRSVGISGVCQTPCIKKNKLSQAPPTVSWTFNIL